MSIIPNENLYISVVESPRFTRQAKKILGENGSETLVEKLSKNPRLGKRLSGVNNVYMLSLGAPAEKRHEHNVVYFYQSKGFPVYLIGINKNGAKNLLSRVVNDLIEEVLIP